ncbi:MAG: hypothetical protein IPO87_07685 [Flavobacteriales bacterium]|nr:hypothetical protein [Flavobacteriales bacterium]
MPLVPANLLVSRCERLHGRYPPEVNTGYWKWPGATAQGGVLNCNVSSIMLRNRQREPSAWSGPNGFKHAVQNLNAWVQLVSTTWLLPERTVAQATLPLKLLDEQNPRPLHKAVC